MGLVLHSTSVCDLKKVVNSVISRSADYTVLFSAAKYRPGGGALQKGSRKLDKKRWHELQHRQRVCGKHLKPSTQH